MTVYYFRFDFFIQLKQQPLCKLYSFHNSFYDNIHNFSLFCDMKTVITIIIDLRQVIWLSPLQMVTYFSAHYFSTEWEESKCTTSTTANFIYLKNKTLFVRQETVQYRGWHYCFVFRFFVDFLNSFQANL
jgi:hypothetical protein